MNARDLVPTEIPATSTGPYGPWLEALGKFYKGKLALAPKVGVFSCAAVESFPHGWLAAFKSGVWPEGGDYGDNFREFFGLQKDAPEIN
jgi:hypothetical protein